MSIRPLARTLAGLGFCIASLSASAAGASYSGLVVFGDSLSDSGNNALVLSNGGTLPLPGVVIGNDAVYSRIPAATGTYTNGPVWTQYLAQSLGLTLVPSVAGGNNYAFAGAQTRIDGDDLPPVPGFPFSMRTQLGMYLTHPATVVDPNALYILAGGGNNVRVLLDAAALDPNFDLAGQALSTAQNYADDIAGFVTTLKAAGAQHVLVLNTPNLGLTPLANALGLSAEASGLSQLMNGKLSAALHGSGATVFDAYGFMSAAVANAPALGFTNWTNACAAAVNACELDSALFWDAIHPTTKGHQMLAQAVLTTAVPEPATIGLFAAGLAVVALGARRRAGRQQG